MPPEDNQQESQAEVPASDLFYAKTEPETPLTESSEADEVEDTEEKEEASEESEESGEQQDNEEASEEVSEELPEYDVTVDGESRKVTRSELIKGYQLEADATKKTMAAAELSKTAEAKIAQADEALKVLGDIQGEIESLIMADAKSIDWDMLRESDTPEYLRMKEVVAERQSAINNLVAKRNEVVAEKVREESEALHKALGWSDAAKRQADIDELTGYMTEAGITEQVTSHKLMLTMLEASKYRKLMATKKAVLKEVKQAPKTTKPVRTTKAAPEKTAAELFYGSN
jgi:hypothetical protein